MIKIDMDTLNTWGNECLKSTAFSEKEDSKIVLRATRDTTAARHMFGIHRVIFEMVNSTNPPFTWHVLKNGEAEIHMDSVGDLVFGLLNCLDREEFSESFPLHEFNPVYVLLLEKIDERQLIDKVTSLTWPLDADVKHSLFTELNSLVYDYREAFRSEAFEVCMNTYLARSTEMEQGLLSLIDDAFQRTSQVMAIRIDLGYEHPESLPDGQGFVDLEEAMAHRDVLLTALRKVFEESLISCAWKLEHCREKGYGHHILFLLDGCKVSDDVATGAVIGDAWDVAVTKGAGNHLCYNAYKRISNAHSLGVISRRQTKIIRSLQEQAVISMARSDYFMQIHSGLADQAFGVVRYESVDKGCSGELTN